MPAPLHVRLKFVRCLYCSVPIFYQHNIRLRCYAFDHEGFDEFRLPETAFIMPEQAFADLEDQMFYLHHPNDAR